MMPLSRRTILALSIAVSAVVYGAMFAVAPTVAILSEARQSEEAARAFQVRLRDEAPPPPPSHREAELAPRPETPDRMLSGDLASLDPTDLGRSEQVPLLEERIGADPVDREYDLDIDESLIEELDARIIEIAETTARAEVEVARRFVRPSPDRVVAEGEFPVLRRAGVDILEDVISFQRAAGPPGAGGLVREGPDADDGRPPYEEGVVGAALEPESGELSALEMLETRIAQAPVMGEMLEARDYEFIDDLVDIQVDSYIPPGEERGYFRLRIVPREDRDIEILPKDITYVIDASRSIVQRKLDRTAWGVQDAIARLNRQDRFNVIVFRDTSTSFRPELVYATEENKAAAQQFLDGIEAFGGTDIYHAVRPVMEQPTRDGVPNVLFLMSDGNPTSGVRDGRTIINALTAENDQRVTVYAAAGGRNINRYLLDLLAYRNRGESRFSDSLYEVDQAITPLLSRLDHPILVDLRADYGRIDDAEVFPKQLPDFYKGQVVTVYGQFDPSKDRDLVMRLAGRAWDRKKEVVFRASLDEAATGDHDIARRWAFNRIYWLIGEVCRVGETPELLSEIRRLSARYNIRTSYDE